MRIALGLCVLACIGCEVNYEPDVGSLHAAEVEDIDGGIGGIAVGTCGDSDPATTVSFAAQIRPLTQKSPGGCLGCHGERSISALSLGSYEGLRRGGLNSGTKIIVAGKPCDSLLVGKLGLAPPFGARMPYNGPPYFSAAELTLVRDWIAEGAHNN